MRVIVRNLAIVMSLAITATGCSSPPDADVEAARAAVANATTERASEYAPESLKAAQDAQAATDAELKVQEGKWFKSYDRTRELAAAEKAAGDKAASDAVARREATEAAAVKAKADAAAARAKALKAAVPVGGRIQPPTKIKDVKPVYPAIAQTAHIGGVVSVQATIGPDGKVIDAKVVRSVPMLDQAALDAVQQWEYTPALLNGQPVPVVVTATINFTR